MFFSEQLRKFWSQKRPNTSSDGLLYRPKVRTFAASLEAAEAVPKDQQGTKHTVHNRRKKLNLFSSVRAFATLCAGGSMFFREQL